MWSLRTPKGIYCKKQSQQQNNNFINIWSQNIVCCFKCYLKEKRLAATVIFCKDTIMYICMVIKGHFDQKIK